MPCTLLTIVCTRLIVGAKLDSNSKPRLDLDRILTNVITCLGFQRARLGGARSSAPF